MIFTSKGELPTLSLFFFFNDTATTEIYTLSLHDALPIYDAPSTITRLLDIGVPRYLVASVIIGIIAQRLVRIVCRDCKAPAQPDTAVATALGLSAGDRKSTRLNSSH